MPGVENRDYEALLLDLDGTLLDLDIEKFIPAYIEALSGKFTDFLSRENFTRHLFAATKTMVENNDGGKRNETVFYEEFCGRIGKSREQIRPVIDSFYRNDFPRLSCWGKVHPDAAAVIENARRKNLRLVLATNPIFPATAILQRLSWSGFSSHIFDLITTMENMHFCKPNRAYYLEIAGALGIQPEKCLMAGNDTLEDLSASEAGMDTFLVEDLILHRTDKAPVSSYQGKMKDLAHFINNLNPLDRNE